jgi:hypothetical protein
MYIGKAVSSALKILLANYILFNLSKKTKRDKKITSKYLHPPQGSLLRFLVRRNIQFGREFQKPVIHFFHRAFHEPSEQPQIANYRCDCCENHEPDNFFDLDQISILDACNFRVDLPEEPTYPINAWNEYGQVHHSASCDPNGNVFF